MTRVRIQLRNRVNQDQIFHRSPNAKTGSSKRASAVNNVPNIKVPLPGHETTHRTLYAVIVNCGDAGAGIKPFAGLDCVLLDVVHDVEEWWEDVREGHDADGGDDGCEAGEVGNGSAQDKCDRPIDGDDDGP